jgi:serine/threonine protein kinase
MMVGSTFGQYRIAAKLGEGGMGEVYRARDTRLDRDVALKILPALFAADPERLSRFEREAKTLASLNHPHIAQIYGIERAGAVHALAMELVEGDDLSDRIARGAIPLEDALIIRVRSPMRSRPRTSRASSIGISSRPTSRCVPTGSSRSWTSGSRRQ